MIKTDRELLKKQFELSSESDVLKSSSLSSEIRQYQEARSGVLPSKIHFSELGRLLILLRIYRGLSQQDLAEKLKVKPSQICRDERQEYRGLSLERAERILKVLAPSNVELVMKSNRTDVNTNSNLALHGMGTITWIDDRRIFVVLTAERIICGKLLELVNLDKLASLFSLSENVLGTDNKSISFPFQATSEDLAKEGLIGFSSTLELDYAARRMIENFVRRYNKRNEELVLSWIGGLDEEQSLLLIHRGKVAGSITISQKDLKYALFASRVKGLIGPQLLAIIENFG